MPRALTFAASLLSPETTMIGADPADRIWPATVNPSGPGIARSSRTRSGCSSRKRRTAVRPSYAVMTWWPSVPTRAFDRADHRGVVVDDEDAERPSRHVRA